MSFLEASLAEAPFRSSPWRGYSSLGVSLVLHASLVAAGLWLFSTSQALRLAIPKGSREGLAIASAPIHYVSLRELPRVAGANLSAQARATAVANSAMTLRDRKAPSAAATVSSPSGDAASAGEGGLGGDPRASTPGRADGDAPASPVAIYLYGLRALIDQRKSYPALARRRGEEGTVLVALVVGRDGSLSDLKLRRGSGSARLDAAALETVASVQSFRPLPPEIAAESLSVEIPIEYSL